LCGSLFRIFGLQIGTAQIKNASYHPVFKKAMLFQLFFNYFLSLSHPPPRHKEKPTPKQKNPSGSMRSGFL
jgi:hypothetical protein